MYCNSTDWLLVQRLSQLTLFAVFNAHPPRLGCRGEKKCFCIFSILMFGEKAVCPDGFFVPAVFRESDFHLNSLTCLNTRFAWAGGTFFHFQLCCYVSFMFWWEIDCGFTYYLCTLEYHKVVVFC